VPAGIGGGAVIVDAVVVVALAWVVVAAWVVGVAVAVFCFVADRGEAVVVVVVGWLAAVGWLDEPQPAAPSTSAATSATGGIDRTVIVFTVAKEPRACQEGPDGYV
jgi:hypothetical protein